MAKKKTVTKKDANETPETKKRAAPMKMCDKCGNMVPAPTRTCRVKDADGNECGYVFPRKTKTAPKATSKKTAARTATKTAPTTNDPLALLVQIQDQIGYENLLNLFDLVRVYGDADTARSKIKQLTSMMK